MTWQKSQLNIDTVAGCETQIYNADVTSQPASRLIARPASRKTVEISIRTGFPKFDAHAKSNFARALTEPSGAFEPYKHAWSCELQIQESEPWVCREIHTNAYMYIYIYINISVYYMGHVIPLNPKP